ncbi:MAG: type II toxin-antitoxin system VapC family toxin [Arenimonas sp.]|nr:type II toxin-antitoxin system VapC family toxin [Arenimonas sp.]MBP7981482.1 type II toxin-antitoxin system VapC family toxin [Arenimonas sp.]
MPSVDTNVLVRLLTGDNATQWKASQVLFSSEDIFIADTVILETEWVLRAAYDLNPAAVCAALRRVCGLPNVSLANGQTVANAINWHESGLDFADAFHLALSQNHQPLKTFDTDFIKRSKTLSDCRVEKP